MKPYVPRMPPGSRWADELPGHLWDNLAARPPELAAAATGAELDRGRLVLPVFAEPHLVDLHHRRVQNLARSEVRVDYNTALALVSHLTREKAMSVRDVFMTGKWRL
jgi:hypothetical protein